MTLTNTKGKTEGVGCGCEAQSGERKAIGVEPALKTANLRRLRRIEGQIRGLQRMVEEDRYCADIMMQMTSVQEALRAVGRTLLRNHVRHCVTQAISTSSAKEAEAMYDELLDLIYKHSRYR